MTGSCLTELMKEKGLTRYALFFTSGEGHVMPNGEEEYSGFVIDDKGRIHSWWIKWNTALMSPAFSYWKTAKEESHWLENGEYLEARRRVLEA